MEVSFVETLDTHAVMGGGQAKAFRMAETAEFFTVLSDTLYSNKRLAVVREVLCNAWDAHIKVKRQDTPVKITLTNKELMIEDYGPGIPEDAIVDIYCTYGKSTKVRDDDQTGGFGLGSKAPFAYTSHFTVTNRHRGFKTIYAVSRGSAATAGKPDIRQMARMPEETTGVTVTIPLAIEDDKHTFQKLIAQVVAEGDINARLNDEPLTTYNLSLAEKIGFTLGYKLHKSNKVLLRYGAVLYPVDMEHQDLKGIQRFPENMKNKLGNVQLILFAPPNSVGVTPSRESLSYTETTIDTIKALIERSKAFLENLNTSETARQMERNEGRQALTLEAVYRTNHMAQRGDWAKHVATSITDIEATLAEVGLSPLTSLQRLEQRIKGALQSTRQIEAITKAKGHLRRSLRLVKQRVQMPEVTYDTRYVATGYHKALQARLYMAMNRKNARQLTPHIQFFKAHVFATHFQYNRCSLGKLSSKHLLMGILSEYPKAMLFESKVAFERFFERHRREEHGIYLLEQGTTAARNGIDSWEFKDWFEKRFKQAIVFVAPKSKWAEAETVAKLMGMQKIERPDGSRPQVQVEARLYDASKLEGQNEDNELYRFDLLNQQRANDTFSIVIPCRKTTQNTAVVYPGERFSRMKPLIDHFDRAGRKVGLAISAAEKQMALKGGLQMFSSAVADELEKVLKSKAVLAHIATRKLHVPYTSWDLDRLKDTIEKWIAASPEVQELFFPRIPRLNEQDAALMTFWDTVHDNLFVAEACVRDVTARITKAAGESPYAKKWQDAFPKMDAILAAFPGIDLLHNQPFSPSVLAFLKMTRKHGSKYFTGDKPNG